MGRALAPNLTHRAPHRPVFVKGQVLLVVVPWATVMLEVASQGLILGAVLQLLVVDLHLSQVSTLKPRVSRLSPL